MGIDQTTLSLIAAAVDARTALMGEPHDSATRLFNGFYEGAPELVLDLYARTLVIHDFASVNPTNASRVAHILDAVMGKLPWIKAAV